MNLVNLISSLHKDDKAILKMAIDRKHLSAFLKYLEDFKGDLINVKLTLIISPLFFEKDENTGERVFNKIKAMKAVKDLTGIAHIGRLKDFIEGNGTIDVYEKEMKALEQIGIGVEIVE